MAVPEALIPEANQLMLIVSESINDDKTFGVPTYEDSSGNKYSLCSAAVKPAFIGKATVALSANPDYAPNADRVAAQIALDSIKGSGGIRFSLNPNKPHIAIRNWGLTLIETDV